MAGSEANVAHLRSIGRLAQQAGLRVLEAGGWTTRGRDWAVLRPEYVVCHHTAAPVDVDRLLIEGRADLPGPLANLALHADGTVVLIASGLANHAGVATISSTQAWGIEATGPIPTGNTGPDAFPQLDAYVTLCAAIRVHHGWPASSIVGHKEIARPDGRKIDPAFGSTAPAPYDDMRRFRAQVEQRVRAWGQEDTVTKDELRAMIPEIAEQVATNLAPVVKRYAAASRLLVKHPDHPHVYAVEGGRLVHLQDATRYAAYSGGRGVAEAVVVLPASDGIWELPISGEVPWA